MSICMAQCLGAFRLTVGDNGEDPMGQFFKLSDPGSTWPVVVKITSVQFYLILDLIRPIR